MMRHMVRRPPGRIDFPFTTVTGHITYGCAEMELLQQKKRKDQLIP